MARLYRYVKSSEKSGYFIIGDDGNATFQLIPVARRLFNKLGFDPPTKTENQGSQVAPELLWALYDIGWIYTGEDDSGSTNDTEIASQENLNELLTDEMVTEIKQFIEERGQKDVEELAGRLNIETEHPEKDRLSTLVKPKQEPLEQYVYGFMEAALTNVEEENIRSIDVTYLDLSNEQEISSLNIHIETTEDDSNCRHTITANEESGVTSVVSATEASQSWEERGRMDEHRGHLFDAISVASDDTNIDLNFGDNEVRGDVDYHTSFEKDIIMPD